MYNDFEVLGFEEKWLFIHPIDETVESGDYDFGNTTYADFSKNKEAE